MTNPFDNLEAEPDTIGTSMDTRVVYGSEGWHDYVMSQFRDGELDNGQPKCDGLRRLLTELCGDILSSEIDILQCPNHNNGYIATAKCTINFVFNDKIGDEIAIQKVLRSDVADACRQDTPAPFNKHLSATAATKAEARVLRKLLGLNTIAAEEGQIINVDDEFNPDETISNAQVILMDRLCKELNIDVMKFVNSGKSKIVYKSIAEVLHHKALNMIEFLHTYQKDKNRIPLSIKGYQEGWNG